MPCDAQKLRNTDINVAAISLDTLIQYEIRRDAYCPT